MSIHQLQFEKKHLPDRTHDDAESSLLAKLNHGGELCLAGIQAVIFEDAPMLKWAVKTPEEEIVVPPREYPYINYLDSEDGAIVGHIWAKEVAPLGVGDLPLKPRDILNLSEESMQGLIWTPVSFVYAVSRAGKALASFR